MKINFSYHDVSSEDKIKLENYASAEKLQSLTRLLQHGNYDLAELDVRAVHMAHHNNYEVKMDLEVKKHVLVSEETAFNLTEAFDIALERIVVQLRKLESLKHDK